jgi:TPR repeat protein
MNQIGDLYMYGDGVAFEPEQAIVWWQLAADLGDPQAQVSIGISHLHGIGFPQDILEAYHWFDRAAASGNEKAAALRHEVLGQMRGEDLINAKQCGMDLLNSEVVPDQIDELRRAGTAGDIDSQCALGFASFTGRGVEQDASESLRWYRLAAEQGHPGAQYVVAIMCGAGFGQTKDDAKAVNWCRQSAEQGDADAQHEIGIMYSMGTGVPKDDVQAVIWWRKSADQGNAGAQNDLGVKYHKGKGVVQDDVEAVKWFRKAAEQGHVDAQFFLGSQYMKGEGVAKDNVIAYMWFYLSSNQGNVYAEKLLAGLAKEMTPEQIAEAEELSRKWGSKHAN